MTHLFAATPDDRQAESHIQTSRFRPRYRQLTIEEKNVHDEIKQLANELESIYTHKVKPGRYNSLAMTALEESVMWIIKELTA